jgi:hypothetical protein
MMMGKHGPEADLFLTTIPVIINPLPLEEVVIPAW